MGYRAAIAIWLAGFCGMFCAIGFIGGAPQLLQLSKGYRQVPGTVVEALPNSHGTIVVRYVVDGKDYEQKYGPYSWPAGTIVTVYYSPSDATLSAITEPTQRLMSEAPFAVLGSIMVAAGLLAGVFFLRRGWSRPANPMKARLQGPRAVSLLLLAVALANGITAAVFGPIGAAHAVASLFLIAGSSLFALCVWRSKAGWSQIFRLTPSWISSGLVLVGVLIDRLAG